jgi:hypothetical protein
MTSWRSRVRLRRRVDAEPLADMGKSFRIGEASIDQHRAQFNKPRLDIAWVRGH